MDPTLDFVFDILTAYLYLLMKLIERGLILVMSLPLICKC